MKFRNLALISTLALFSVILAISMASADCVDNQRILRLSALTNSHAEIYTGAYPVQICYNEIFSNLIYNGATSPAHPASCANPVMRLIANTNAHAELPDYTNPLGNYPINICYGDLQCYSTTNNVCNQAGERIIASLASQTNSHLSNGSSYLYKICCSSQFFISSIVCGNGVRQGTEQCDDGNLNTNDACKNDCTNNICGDGIIYTGIEQCDDGNTINNDGCSSTCQNELICGNGNIDAGEQCDSANLANLTCQDINGYTGGTLSCLSSCLFNTSQCTGGQPGICGDNIVNPGETCDNANFTGLTCSSFGFSGGSLTCNLCQISTSQCTNGGGGNGGNNGGNNKDNGGIVGLFRGDENPVTSFFAGEEEIETGKKLEAEESLLNKFFAFIQSDSLKLILLPLLLFIILMILLIALLAGRKRNLSVKNNNSVPSKS